MKRILVVDDSAENRFLLEAMLQAYGFEVDSAANGVEALVRARGNPPHLVISDILMPVMDGFALCKQWQAEAPLCDIPFIFYTATYTDRRDEKLASELGADRFVIKPQEPQAMIEIIQDVIALSAKSVTHSAVANSDDNQVKLQRKYGDALARKLEQKVAELDATRGALGQNIRRRQRVELALEQSKQRWRLIYDAEPECIKVVSATGNLIEMNRAGLAMIEADSLDQVRGQPILSLVAPEYRDSFLKTIATVISGQPCDLAFQAIGLKGAKRWMEAHAVPIEDDDGNVAMLSITRDISESFQVNALMSGQLNVLELIASGVPINESLEALLRVLEQQSDGMFCSILLRDETGQHLMHGAAPSLPQEYCIAIDGIVIGPNAGSCGTAAFRREMVIVEDIATDPLWADFKELALRHGLRACWSTPIFDDAHRILGTFAMYFDRPACPNEFQLRLIELGTQSAAIAIAKDRDDRELLATQAALQASEERMTLAIAAADGGIFEHEHISDRTYFSPTFRLITGCGDLEQGLLPTILEMVHPNDFAEVSAAMQRGHDPAGDGGFHVEYRMIRRDGSVCWISIHSQTRFDGIGLGRRPVRTVGILRDISQRRIAQEAVSASERKFRSLVENIGDVIVLFDDQAKILYVSPSEERLQGYKPNETIGTNAFERIHPNDVTFMRAKFANLVCTLDRSEDAIFRVLHKDGRWRWVEGIAINRLNDPAINAIIATYRDITERVHSEQKIQQYSDELQILSRRLLDVQEGERRHLARELHDELGQVLSAISMNLKILSDKVVPDAKPRLDESVFLVDRAVDQVRNLSLALRPAVLDDFGLKAALRWYAQTQAERGGFSVNLTANPSLDEPGTHIRNACFRIFQEALTNVVRHANASQVWIDLTRDEHGLQLSVRDDGQGYDVSIAQTRASHGESLGLLSMRERAELLGGEVEYQSAPGQGTTVLVRFPTPVDEATDN